VRRSAYNAQVLRAHSAVRKKARVRRVLCACHNVGDVPGATLIVAMLLRAAKRTLAAAAERSPLPAVEQQRIRRICTMSLSCCPCCHAPEEMPALLPRAAPAAASLLCLFLLLTLPVALFCA